MQHRGKSTEAQIRGNTYKAAPKAGNRNPEKNGERSEEKVQDVKEGSCSVCSALRLLKPCAPDPVRLRVMRVPCYKLPLIDYGANTSDMSNEMRYRGVPSGEIDVAEYPVPFHALVRLSNWVGVRVASVVSRVLYERCELV
jgi:hypothetical protein